jgi:hypothetical protein
MDIEDVEEKPQKMETGTKFNIEDAKRALQFMLERFKDKL